MMQMGMTKKHIFFTLMQIWMIKNEQHMEQDDKSDAKSTLSDLEIIQRANSFFNNFEFQCFTINDHDSFVWSYFST